MADSWVVLDQSRHGVQQMLRSTVGYHYIPVAEAFTWLLWRLSGLHVTRYQVLNLAELVLVAWAFYLFGTALLRRPWISFMASLLLIASPAIHEVTHWAVIGNFHLLAGLFYLAGLGVALRMGRDETRRGPVWLGWLFALFLCLAVLTYEATITMLPVGFALWLVARPSRAMAEGMGWSRTLAAWAPSVLALVPGVLARAHFGRGVQGSTNWGIDWAHRVYAVRGLLATFSLRDGDPLSDLLGWGLYDGRGHILPYLIGWLAVFTALAVLAWWKGSWPVRLLVFWFALHWGVSSLAVMIQSRHYFLLALPGSLLVALGLATVGQRARRLVEGRLVRAGQVTALAVPALVLCGLLVGCLRDLGRCRAVYGRAAAANQALIESVRARANSAGSHRIVLVDLPARIREDGYGAYPFLNGTHQLISLFFGSEVKVELVRSPTALDDVANGSVPLAAEDIATLSRAADVVFLRWDEASERLVTAPGPGAPGAPTAALTRRPRKYELFH